MSIPKEIHAILTETLGQHATLYATVKNWVAQFKLSILDTKQQYFNIYQTQLN